MHSGPLLLQVSLKEDGCLWWRSAAGLSVGVIAACRGKGGVRLLGEGGRRAGRGSAHSKGLSLLRLLLLNGRWGRHGACEW